MRRSVDGNTVLRSATPLPRTTRARARVRCPTWLIDSTKSEMRGAISERKREPLNTP